MNKKTIISIIIAFSFIAGAIYFALAEDESKGIAEKPIVNGSNEPEEKTEIPDEFIQCLKEEGVVIYGSSTCPACARLEEEYGGYEKVKSIYLDCSGLGSQEEAERCMEEMQTSYIPEVHIKGRLFEGWGSPEALAEATGCQLE